MIKIATPHFDFESKKAYQKPTINVVKLQHQTYILAGSGPDTLEGHAMSGEETEDTWFDLE